MTEPAGPEHRRRPPPERRAPDPAAAEAPAGHPLLELQRQAGNAAVARLVGQRHTLNPEEEGG